MSSVKRGTLAVACLATAMLMLDVAVVNTAIPHMGIDLHVGLGALKWVIDAYTLALATTVLTLGSLADRLGRRSVFAGRLIIFTAASLVCAAAHRVVILDTAGTGLINPALSRVALDSAPATMGGLAAGVNDTARQTGIAVGIAALGALIRVNAVGSQLSLYVHDLRVGLVAAAGVAFAGAVGAWRRLSVRAAPAAGARVIAAADAR